MTQRLIYHIIIILTIAFFASCSEEIYYNKEVYIPSLYSNHLSIYPKDYEFNNGMDESSGQIEAEQSWSFIGVPSWLTISPNNGNGNKGITLKTISNENVNSRQAVFFIESNNPDYKLQRSITASQKGAIPYIEVLNQDNTINVNASGSTLDINIKTNIDAISTILSSSKYSDNSINWATVSYNESSQSITISIAPNTSINSRDAYLKIKSAEYSITRTLTLHQYGSMMLGDSKVDFDAEGGSQIINIKSDVAWQLNLAETYSWLNATPTSGDGGSYIDIEISATPSYESSTRNGYINLYFEGNSSYVKQIRVEQTGRYINTTPSNVNITAEGIADNSINVSSNIDWEIKSAPEWVILDKMKGESGESYIKVSAEKNNSVNARTGSVILSDSHFGGISKTISIQQNGLEISDNTLEFNWQSSIQSLKIPFPKKWQAAISDGWISLSQYTGTGETLIDVSVLRNDSESMRQGTISITTEGQTFIITVLQQGQYIYIENTNSLIEASGGIVDFTYNSSIEVTPSVEYVGDTQNWINYTEKETGYNIQIKSNPSSFEREAYFVLSPNTSEVASEWNNGVKFKIYQLGRTLTTDVVQINIFASGGSTELYKIQADGDYLISKKDDVNWFSIIHNIDDHSFYVVVTENDTSEKRVGAILVNLTNLPDGERKEICIPIVQGAGGIDVVIDDFKDPIIW